MAVVATPAPARAPTGGQLTGLSGFAADVLDRFGEVGLALLVALENVFPPIPSEPILTLAGVLATQGRLSLALVLLSSTAGSVLGALVLFELGGRLGRVRLVRLVERLPLVDVGGLERAEAWFTRHGSSAVLLGRFVPVLRSLVSVPAGIERMPRGRFVLLTAIGSGAWNAAFIGIGYGLGSSVDLDVISRALDAVLVGTALVGAVVLVRRLLRHRRAAAAGQRPGPR